MGGKQVKPPRPAKLLYENIFVRRDREGSLVLLSEGLVAFAENAERLIDDAVALVKAERYGTAAFLVATADEEMAKSYILLDACRLDFSRYESVLRSLCRAFYNHVAKHAYSKVTRSTCHNMAHVKEVWDVETTRWWPSPGYESGEPDMPHETYFEREMPLYVDFVDQDQKWFTPRAGTRKYVFEGAFSGHDALSESRAALERLRESSRAGLYRPESLSILNEIFRRHYINEGTPTEQVDRLYEETAEQMESELGIDREGFGGSALCEWPLYHFVGTGF